MRNCLKLAAAFVGVAGFGCTHPALPADDNSYNVGVVNLTATNLEGLQFLSPQLKVGFGIVVPGYNYKKIMGLFSKQPPKTGQLEFTTPAGEHFSVPVSIPSPAVPFQGYVFFKVRADYSVSVEVLQHRQYYSNDGMVHSLDE